MAISTSSTGSTSERMRATWSKVTSTEATNCCSSRCVDPKLVMHTQFYSLSLVLHLRSLTHQPSTHPKKFILDASCGVDLPLVFIFLYGDFYSQIACVQFSVCDVKNRLFWKIVPNQNLSRCPRQGLWAAVSCTTPGLHYERHKDGGNEERSRCIDRERLYTFVHVLNHYELKSPRHLLRFSGLGLCSFSCFPLLLWVS